MRGVGESMKFECLEMIAFVIGEHELSLKLVDYQNIHIIITKILKLIVFVLEKKS